MPSLTETSPIQFKKVERTTQISVPLSQKDNASVPPVPPKRREQPAKREIFKDPPPSYYEDNSIKPMPRAQQILASESLNIQLNATPPEDDVKEPRPEEIRSPQLKIETSPFPAIRTVAQKTHQNPEIIQRPHTFPSIVTEADKLTSSDIPPPLPTSAPPPEDPKPWFEIEEDIVDQTISSFPRVNQKKPTDSAPPAPRISNPTDELPILGTTEPRLTPKINTKFLDSPDRTLNPSDLVEVPKIEQNTLPPIQKPSKIKSFLGLSSHASPEPPKPKARRIRVPKKKSPKANPKPMPRTISTNSANIQPPSPTINEDYYDTSISNISAKSPVPVNLPEPPVRKAKIKNEKGPKQLSFAETATVFLDENEVRHENDQGLENDGDSWDLVAKHRANINKNASKMQADARRPKNATGTEIRVDFVPIDRPKTMREMRKSQSTGAGVNLRNKDRVVDSDTEV